MVTLWHQVSPALLAMGELWLRLLAYFLAPVCMAHLFWEQQSPDNSNHSKSRVAISCLLAVASSAVLTTDMLYVLEFGHMYGVTLLVLSSILAFRSSIRHRMKLVTGLLLLICVLVVHLVWDRSTGKLQFGGPEVPRVVQEGLYFDATNALMSRVASEWPMETRTYTVKYGATPWLPTGDSRTGIPFLVNSVTAPTWTRVWVPTHDDEAVALDFSFPSTGYDETRPLFLILHGLNGGSGEGYVMDFANRRNEEGSTVVVMVARGLMDLPVKGTLPSFVESLS
jgi:hypothetical protein